MKKLIECVPNISEGKNINIIYDIAEKIKKSGNSIKVLNIDSDKDTNRTVYTFIGSPEDIIDAAFECIKRSYELIDMRHHKGIHPRQGCTDVCPFIPLQNTTMTDCIHIAKQLAIKVAKELKIPVYLYGKAAISQERQKLENIRRGEYESLKYKLQNFPPDYGPSLFNKTIEKAGAITIGARDFLIAYNINLNTNDISIAKKIAETIRESGKVIIDNKGIKQRIPGILKNLKAIGWFLKERNIVQVSTNIINYKKTPIHLVFETCLKEAKKLNTEVIGSEIIGMVTKDSLIQTGKYYLAKFNNYTEEELIDTAIKYLGLYNFKKNEKVIEYRINTIDFNKNEY